MQPTAPAVGSQALMGQPRRGEKILLTRERPQPKIDAIPARPLESIRNRVVPHNRLTLMPLYEYECKKCGHRFEKIQKFSDRMVKKCPECGGQVEQMISAPAVQFKGSGWYVTDYAKKPSQGSTSTGDSASKDKKNDKPKSDSGSKDSPAKEGTSKESSSKDSSAKESSSKESPRRGSGRQK